MYQGVSDGPSENWFTSHRFAASTVRNATHDLAFEVKDATGRPLAGYPYLIELPNGTRLEGFTDSDGFTRKVGAMNSELATLTVYTPEPSAIDSDWDR
jgi:hypothetical protein